jgi:pimeloyl-ACP methyl ester carboxylesterase
MIAFNDFSEIQSAPLFLRCAGSGAPLVLLHGLSEEGDSWQNIAPALADKFEVWLPDLSGAGRSPLPATENLTIEDMADALYESLQLQGLESITLIGHSMGGYVALAFLEKYGEMLNGIALVHSTPAADNEEKKEQRQKAISLLRGGKKETFLKSMSEKLFAPAFLVSRPEIAAEQFQRSNRSPVETLVQHNSAMAARPARTDALRDTKIPVQWVLGEEDQVLPLDATLAFVALPALSFLSIYKEVGHMSMTEVPERLIADLLRFGRLCAMR